MPEILLNSRNSTLRQVADPNVHMRQLRLVPRRPEISQAGRWGLGHGREEVRLLQVTMMAPQLGVDPSEKRASLGWEG